MGIPFFGGVDPDTGIVVEKGHPLEGQSNRRQGAGVSHRERINRWVVHALSLEDERSCPSRHVNAQCETITAVGCIIADPCVDQIPIEQITTCDRISLDGEQGTIEITETRA